MTRHGRAYSEPNDGAYVEKLAMNGAADRGRSGRKFGNAAFALAASVLITTTPAVTQEQRREPELKDCAQDDVASFAIRACTALIMSEKFNTPDFSIENRARIYAWRGKAWMTEDDPAAAAADFSSALTIDPRGISVLKNRALAYTKLGEHTKAAEDWSRVIADQSKNDQYYRSRGTSLLAAGRHAEALADFDKSLEINSSGVDAYIGRAAVYDSLGDQTQAKQEFDHAIALNPGYLSIYWERAVMAERWGEQKLAIKDYEMVLKINGVYSHARKALRRLGIEHPP